MRGEKKNGGMGWCIYEYMLQLGRFTLGIGIELSYRDKRWSRVLPLHEGSNRVLIGCWLSAPTTPSKAALKYHQLRARKQPITSFALCALSLSMFSRLSII